MYGSECRAVRSFLSTRCPELQLWLLLYKLTELSTMVLSNGKRYENGLASVRPSVCPVGTLTVAREGIDSMRLGQCAFRSYSKEDRHNFFTVRRNMQCFRLA